MDLSFLGEFDRIYAYQRVSSQTQFDRNTLEMQHNRLCGINPPPNHIFGDVQGGDERERPQYQALIDKVQLDALAGLKVLVVITDQSRLSREGVDAVSNLVELFDALKVVLYALDSGLMTVADPSQRLMVGSKALYHDYFLREHRQRLRSASAQRRKEGRPLAPNAPFGYKWSREKYVPSEHWDLARQMVVHYLPPSKNAEGETYGDGWSLRRCAEWLREQGIPRSPHGFRKLLLNPIWRGHLFHTKGGDTREEKKTRREVASRLGVPVQQKTEKEYFLNTHPALISEDEYKLILWRLEDNRQNARQGTSTRRYPLSGLVFCGYCDRKLTVKITHDKRWGRYTNYQCRNEECEYSLSISGRMIETQIIAALTTKASELAALAAQPMESEVNPETYLVEQQIADLEKMYATMPLEGLRSAIAEQKARLKALLEKPAAPKAADVEALIATFSDPLAWALLTEAEQRQIYHAVVQKVVIKRDREMVVTLLL